MLTRVFFSNNSSHALAESAHKWVEISLWLAFTRRESGPEAPPAQRDWQQLPRRYQTLQDRGALLLARQYHKPYLGSCCWSSGPDGCRRSCCYHTKKIRHFHYHHWRCVLSFVLVEAFQYFNGLRCKSREESHSCSVIICHIYTKYVVVSFPDYFSLSRKSDWFLIPFWSQYHRKIVNLKKSPWKQQTP